MPGLFHSAEDPLGSFILSQMAGFSDFLRLNNISWYVNVIFGLFVHPLRDI